LKLTHIVTPLLFSLFLIVNIWALLYFFLKDRKKAGFLASIMFLLSFSYGHIVNVIESEELPGWVTSNIVFPIIERWPLEIYGICSVVFLIMIIRLLKNKWGQIAPRLYVLNVVSAAMLILPLVTIAKTQLNRVQMPVRLFNPPIVQQPSTKAPHDLPDIYYIILDRYASNETLLNYYDFDNSGFTTFLKSKGFYVAQKSFANYPFTSPSLASSLNMNYIDDLASQIDPEVRDSTPLYERIQDNAVALTLKAKGYKFLYYGPQTLPGVPMDSNKHADYVYAYSENAFSLSAFDFFFWGQSVVPPIISRLWNNEKFAAPGRNSLVRRTKYAMQLDEIEKVSTTVRLKGPKFIFFHSLLTHPPNVLDIDGTYVPEAIARKRSPKENYLRQLQFSNYLIQQLIETILEDSLNPPIIVLQSDEGPYPQRFREHNLSFDWREATADEMKEKMGILNAYYFPGVSQNMFYPTITPVNTFRIIFNKYLGTQLPLLPDKNFGQIQFYFPYAFFDATNLLHE